VQKGWDSLLVTARMHQDKRFLKRDIRAKKEGSICPSVYPKILCRICDRIVSGLCKYMGSQTAKNRSFRIRSP